MQDFQGMWKPWLLSKYKNSPKGVLEEHISCEFLLSTTSAKKQYLPGCQSLPLINASSWSRLRQMTLDGPFVPEYGVFGDIFPRGGALILTDNYPPRPQFAS